MTDADEANAPAMSVILVTPTGPRFLRRTVQAMAAQTVADRIELIVVAPEPGAREALAPLLAPFHSVIERAAGPIDNVDHAVGRAMPLASAPIIATIEDHAFPDADWAETVLEAYAGTDAVAVGSAMLNANPHGMLSWSNILLAYGQWSEATPEGPIGWVSHHNGSFRRAALEAFDPDEYWQWFTREGTIMQRLAANGGRFHFAPRARVRHLNPSNLRSTAQLRMDAGRLYAANRAEAEGWNPVKRAFYAALGPAIPLLRYVRMRRDLFGKSPDVTETRHGPAMLVGLGFDALGQMAGFLAGPGRARERLATFEMDRLDHLDAHDRALFAPPDVPSEAPPDVPSGTPSEARADLAP